MTPRIYKKLAIMGTLALGIAFTATSAKAQTTFESSTPETINVNAVITNAIDATVVEPDAGVLGVLASTTPGEAAAFTVNPDGTYDLTGAIDGESRIVSNGAAAPGSFTIAAGDAFNDTAVYVTYGTAVDLVCGLCAETTVLELTEVTDDLSTGDGTACPSTTAVSTSLATPTVGCATTAADGALTINVGYTIATVNGNATRPIYNDGVYLGSFDATIEY